MKQVWLVVVKHDRTACQTSQLVMVAWVLEVHILFRTAVGKGHERYQQSALRLGLTNLNEAEWLEFWCVTATENVSHLQRVCHPVSFICYAVFIIPAKQSFNLKLLPENCRIRVLTKSSFMKKIKERYMYMYFVLFMYESHKKILYLSNSSLISAKMTVDILFHKSYMNFTNKCESWCHGLAFVRR